MTPIKAVLFDLDGVLIDATEWHYTALNRALGLFGFSITRYDHLVTYNGLPTRRKLEMLTIERGLSASLHGLINTVKQVYTREEILTGCWPAFEKEYMMSRLRHEGIRLAVCSNAIRESVELMLSRAGLLQYVEFVLSNEDVSAPKPSPAMYELALARLGVQPQEVVIVEDAPHGVQAARSAGAFVCEVEGYAEVDYWRVRKAIDAAEAASETHRAA